jgi:hypothetical protein
MEYDFYTFCPITGCPNNNKPIKWQHYNCGGYTKINDEGYIRCPKCNVKGKVVDWKFSCENHDFEEPNVQKLISILSVMQQILDIDNDDFIIDLSSIVKDQYKEKKKKREEEEKKKKQQIVNRRNNNNNIFNIGFGLLNNLNDDPFFGGFEKMMNDMVSDFEKDFFGNDDDDFFSGIDNFL